MVAERHRRSTSLYLASSVRRPALLRPGARQLRHAPVRSKLLDAQCDFGKRRSNWGSPSYTPTNYESEPIVTSVTYSEPVYTYTYAAPIAYQGRPSSGVTFSPATHAAQLSLFGFPLIGGSIGTSVNW